jgi:hypothetical protein
MDDAERSLQLQAPESSVDWRGRPCHQQRHGGMRAAVFILGGWVAVGWVGAVLLLLLAD